MKLQKKMKHIKKFPINKNVFDDLDKLEKEFNSCPRPYLDDNDNIDTRFGFDPDNWEVGVAYDEVQIQFMAGPIELVDGNERFSDAASCNNWIEEVLSDLIPPNGYILEVGSAENLHSVYEKSKIWNTPENDPIAIEFVDKCVKRLIECGAKLLN